MTTSTLPSPDTIPALFWGQVERRGDRVALRKKELGIWQETTWTEYAEQVRACGFGLIALDLQPGERVAVLSRDAVPADHDLAQQIDVGAVLEGGVVAALIGGGNERLQFVLGLDAEGAGKFLFLITAAILGHADRYRPGIAELFLQDEHRWIPLFGCAALGRGDFHVIIAA